MLTYMVLTRADGPVPDYALAVAGPGRLVVPPRTQIAPPSEVTQV